MLGLIEGVADALAGVARFIGGPLADDPARRRRVAAGGYTATAVLAALTAGATAAWQVGVLRAGAWFARGLRVPSRNALLADLVTPAQYGRAYAFERLGDNAGAVVGPLLALGLVSWVGVRTAIGLSVIPGLLAAAAILYAIRAAPKLTARDRTRLRITVRPLLRGSLGRLLGASAAFEVANVAATLLILRATDLLDSGRGFTAATQLALAGYIGYNLVATVVTVPAGRIIDRAGAAVGGPRVLAVGAGLFAVGYAVFAVTGGSVALLVVAFALAGAGIGCAETAEHATVAALAPAALRGSAFGLLATVQAAGNLAASAIAGLLYTVASPAAAFWYLAAWMVVASVALAATGARPSRSERAGGGAARGTAR